MVNISEKLTPESDKTARAVMPNFKLSQNSQLLTKLDDFLHVNLLLVTVMEA